MADLRVLCRRFSKYLFSSSHGPGLLEPGTRLAACPPPLLPLAFPNTKYPTNYPLTFLLSPSWPPFPSVEISPPETLASFLDIFKLFLERHGDPITLPPKPARLSLKHSRATGSDAHSRHPTQTHIPLISSTYSTMFELYRKV